MKLQRQLSNGNWVNDDRVEYFINLALERESWYAPRVNRQPMTSQQEVIDYLAIGKVLRYDDDWYANIRDGEVYDRKLTDAKARRDTNPNYSNAGWLLDCGHRVHYKSHIMRANLGTSCQDCYDRMSD